MKTEEYEYLIEKLVKDNIELSENNKLLTDNLNFSKDTVDKSNILQESYEKLKIKYEKKCVDYDKIVLLFKESTDKKDKLKKEVEELKKIIKNDSKSNLSKNIDHLGYRTQEEIDRDSEVIDYQLYNIAMKCD